MLARLGAFRFLYFRYQPQCYYYSLLLLSRNALVPLVPAFLQASFAEKSLAIGKAKKYETILPQHLRSCRTAMAASRELCVNLKEHGLDTKG
eukprot:192596-Amphidinium_carterae.1